MSVSSPSARLPSLSEAARGQPLEVRVIVFEAVRSHCYTLALQVGDIVRRLDDAEAAISVELPDGKRVVMPRECADFIGVRALPVPLAARPASATRSRPDRRSGRTRARM